ncbi:MAG: monophosphatase [Solirubrobacteraceae bacterium]|nr:monophosphatase [Solirubrobacteraceae bacterium]
MPSNELLAIAETAARAAGAGLVHQFGDDLRVSTKSTPTDPVSEADRAAEAAIRAVLAESRPGDIVLGEEGGEDAAGVRSGALRWVVDPLDGTVNYLFGIPHWSVSVAVEDAEGALAGVVLDPLRDECFSAVRGGGAFVNGARVVASQQTELSTSLVATGFAYDAAWRARQGEVAPRLLGQVRDLRRMGSAALDLAWSACGRYDAYFERAVKPWDRAAGVLLCLEAGLTVVELAAGNDLPAGVLVAPAGIVDELTGLVSG